MRQRNMKLSQNQCTIWQQIFALFASVVWTSTNHTPENDCCLFFCIMHAPWDLPNLRLWWSTSCNIQSIQTEINVEGNAYFVVDFTKINKKIGGKNGTGDGTFVESIECKWRDCNSFFSPDVSCLQFLFTYVCMASLAKVQGKSVGRWRSYECSIFARYCSSIRQEMN